MRPNVEFRVDLPKTNPGLAKSHLQRHVTTRKKKRPQQLVTREGKNNRVNIIDCGVPSVISVVAFLIPPTTGKTTNKLEKKIKIAICKSKSHTK